MVIFEPVRRIEAGQYVGPRRIAPEIPRRLARLIRRCLHPKPKRRIASATELRRALEQIVGQPAPLDCRRTIADWLWARNVFKSDDGGTVRSPRRVRALRKLRTPVRLAAASAALFVLVADVGAIHLGGLRGLPIARLLGADGTAWVRFETEPGTEIRIGSVPLDAAARSGSIELPAGRHDVVFVHPERGRVERTLSLDAGEELVIGHVFSGDDASPGD